MQSNGLAAYAVIIDYEYDAQPCHPPYSHGTLKPMPFLHTWQRFAPCGLITPCAKMAMRITELKVLNTLLTDGDA